MSHLNFVLSWQSCSQTLQNSLKVGGTLVIEKLSISVSPIMIEKEYVHVKTYRNNRIKMFIGGQQYSNTLVAVST